MGGSGAGGPGVVRTVSNGFPRAALEETRGAILPACMRRAVVVASDPTRCRSARGDRGVRLRPRGARRPDPRQRRQRRIRAARAAAGSADRELGRGRPLACGRRRGAPSRGRRRPRATRARPGRARVHARAPRPTGSGSSTRSGPLGIATGGSVQLQVSPFWGWSTPQVARSRRARLHRGPRDARRHRARARDARPAAARDPGHRAAARRGRAVEIVYGAGPRARADRPLRRARRAVLDRGRRRRRRRARVPRRLARRRRRGRARRRAARDTAERRAARREGPRRARGARRRAQHRRRVRGRCGVRRSAGGARAARVGALRRHARAGAARSRAWRASRAPIASRWRPASCARAATRWSSSAEGPRVLWADLHGHSAFSDGTGPPEDYFLYARDVAALDVAALTDHDHWGSCRSTSTPSSGTRSARRRAASTRPAAS